MILFLAQVSAVTFAQKLTYKRQGATLRQVFAQIRMQTGYHVLYSEQKLDLAKKFDVDFSNSKLDEVLNQVLGEELDYSIENKDIFIKRKTPSLLDRVVATFDVIDVRGRVTDNDGRPLIGANVYIAGQNKGTFTDANGRFQLSGLDEKSVLEISYVGYLTKKVKAKTYLDIVLELIESKLNEVQVIAYGTEQKRFSVGSVSTVTAEQIAKQPVTNVLLALSGQAPGLAINATSGVPGSRVQLQIRGQNTIKSDGWLKPYDQPLFIIDGTPFAPQNNNISQLGNLAAGQSFNGGISQFIGMSPFNGINPADIESISVLKDADATSIYGTQGSNGVILITTKKGKVGKTIFDFSANSSFNTAAQTLKLMNTQQYLQMRRDAFAADGITPSMDGGNYSEDYAPDLLIFDQNKYTNWQNVLFGKTSSTSDFHGSLSGGTESNTFLVSAGYTKSNYNFPGAGYADKRMTLHSALHHNSSDNRLTMDLNMEYGYDQNNSPSGGAQNVLMPPNLPELLDAQGNLVWNYKGVDLSSYQFYGYLKKPVLLQNYNLMNTLRLAYKIIPGLSISANMGYSRNTSAEHSVNPAAAQSPTYASASAQFGNIAYQSINVEPQIDYTYAWGKSVVTALLGGSYKKNTTSSNTLQGSDYANDNFLSSINGAASVYANDDGDFYKYSAGFARFKYIYDQKYILSLTGRRDGSSNFGPRHQFGNFGSVGAGWIVSEENAFKAALPFISFAKLSGSYGTSGSDGITSYLYQSLWQPVGFVPAFQGTQPNIPLNLYNPDYSWALKKSLNMALDLGFFHDRMLLNATFYRNREGNQLGGYPLPAQVGLPSVLQNLPSELQNKGWEFSINSTNIRTKDFSWSTNFNISFNRNKLLSFPNLESSSYSSEYVLGQSVSTVIGYRFKGLNPTTGLFEFYDKNGNTTNSPAYGQLSEGGDQVPIGDREVKYMGGIGNNFSYKGFSLSVFFQFSSQMAPNYLGLIYQNYPGLDIANLPLAALDYWKQPGDQTALQKLSTTYSSEASNAVSSFAASSGAYSNDTYLRLKTAALSYNLSGDWLKKAHIGGCRIFVNAQNLLTITNYKVGDPEQFSFTGVPLQRTVAFGLNFNL